MHIAVLGLGEAGSIYAADLASRGASVVGTDLHVAVAAPGVRIQPDVASAVRDADLVLSLVGAGSAASVLADALPAMASAALYADMNTSGPDNKRALAEVAAARGIGFVDVAILAPVTRARIDTPLLVSGPGVAALQPLLTQLRIPAVDVGSDAGAAASRKLLRSVFMKGLAAVVIESVTAAQAFGAEAWVMDQIAWELGAAGDEAVRHLIDGTTKHAVRREAEMIEVRDLLDELGAAHPMTDGTIQWLRALANPASAPENRR